MTNTIDGRNCTKLGWCLHHYFNCLIHPGCLSGFLLPTWVVSGTSSSEALPQLLRSRKKKSKSRKRRRKSRSWGHQLGVWQNHQFFWCTPPLKTNTPPENWWLEDDIFFFWNMDLFLRGHFVHFVGSGYLCFCLPKLPTTACRRSGPLRSKTLCFWVKLQIVWGQHYLVDILVFNYWLKCSPQRLVL